MCNAERAAVDALDSILAKNIKDSNNRVGGMKRQINLKEKKVNECPIALKADAKIKDKAIKDMKYEKECANAEFLGY